MRATLNPRPTTDVVPRGIAGRSRHQRLPRTTGRPFRIMLGIRGNVVVLTALDGRRDLAELLVGRALRQQR